MRLPIRSHFNAHRAGRKRLVHLDARSRHAEFLQLPQGLASEVIVANARNQSGLGAECAGVVGEIRGSAAELTSAGQQIPQNFADANESEFHSSVRSRRLRRMPDLVSWGFAICQADVYLEGSLTDLNPIAHRVILPVRGFSGKHPG